MSYPGFEIEEDLRQERLEWRIQRIVWPLLFLLLAGIMLGLIGGGPLSTKTSSVVRSDNTGKSEVSIEYQRFLRHRAPDLLKITVPADDGKISLQIDRHYFDKIHVKNIMPEPEQSILGKEVITYVFPASPTASANIVIEVQAEQVGTVEGWIAVGDRPRLGFSHFVYP